MSASMPSRQSWSAYVRNLAAVVSALAVLYPVAWYIIAPRVTETLQAAVGTEELAIALAKVQKAQEDLVAQGERQAQINADTNLAVAQVAETNRQVVERIAALEQTSREDRVAPVRFMEDGNSISNGRIGDFVRFDFRYIKSRDCGRPVSVAYFRNGGGIVHAFEASSVTAEDGRGSSGAVSSDVQAARFIARIPADEGVQPTAGEGFAMGWILLAWPDCPNVPEVRSPQVPFQIFPAG